MDQGTRVHPLPVAIPGFFRTPHHFLPLDPVPPDPAQLYDLLDSVMIAEAHRLRSRLRSLDRVDPDPRSQNAALNAIHEAAQRSAELRNTRQSLIPAISYPPDLPVSQRAEQIAQAVRDSQVVVVCGDTGSGKTTQLPKIMLERGFGIKGTIGHTQPRRLAARSVAARIASELNVPMGQQIGSKVRFGDKTGPTTLVKLMTDGILLAEIQSDPNLLAYDALIIDEAHERSLNIDFLLGYLKRLLPKRPDLKIVITSATIDPQRFADHFCDASGAPAKVLTVEGRMYPVEIRHEPPPAGTDRADAIADAVESLWSEQRGDVLVFEPGEREIRETARIVERRLGDTAEILPLYARLAHHHQDQIFKPQGRRRVVVSTNVAETSLTVPGIRYVIDTGLARINRYSPRSKVQRLEVEPISRASARQRAGRCGRVQAGVCVRLYDETDHDARDEFTDPEILRSSLAAVILQMRALKLGAVESFPFIDPPEPRRIADGYELLTQLGALDEHQRITKVGRTLSRLPLDPKLGRVLLTAWDHGVLHEATTIVSALAVEDPRDRPFEQREAADQAHTEFKNDQSDFMVLLSIWRWFERSSKELGSSRLKKECAKRFLSFRKLHEWRATHRQIRLMLAASGYRSEDSTLEDDQLYEPLHRSLLSGLLDGVGKKLDKKDPKSRQWEYEDQRGQRFAIFPGSMLSKSKPKWVVATELVRTARLYARLCARVEPEWIEQVAGPRLKRRHTMPEWNRAKGRVLARERVSLGALELMADRRVHLGPIDPATAHTIFLEQALVAGELRTKPRWVRTTQRTIAQALSHEHKLRAKGALGVEDAAIEWCKRHVPTEVYSQQRLERWLKRTKPADLPQLTLEDLIPDLGDTSEDAFPDEHASFGTPLRMRYTHDPGTTEDGVSVEVLLADLPAVDPERCAWLVPGRRRELVEALLRQLPKAQRRQLDIPALVRTCEQIPARGSLPRAIAEHVASHTTVRLEPHLMDPSRLSDELRLLVRVVDAEGKLIDQDRDLRALQARLSKSVERSQRDLAAEGYPLRGLTGWTFDDPPESIRVGEGASSREVYPAIVDATTAVDLELRTSKAAARLETHAGVRRLGALSLRRELKLDPRRLPGFERAAASYATMGTAGQLRDELMLAVADRAFALHEQGVPLTKAEFEARSQQAWDVGMRAAQEIVEHASRLLAIRHRLTLALADRHPVQWEPAFADMEAQLERLIGPRFLTTTPPEWSRHLERFAQSIDKRISKLRGGGLARDTASMQQIHALEARLAELMQRGRSPDELTHLGWLLNELRVSLFAQELRTSVPVSVKRMQDAIEAAGAE